MAYVSLILDVCIAVITGITVLDPQGTKQVLISADYALTAVVVLSVALFVVLMGMKLKERLAFNEQDESNKNLQ